MNQTLLDATRTLVLAGQASEAWRFARPRCGEIEHSPHSPGFSLVETSSGNYIACTVGKDTIVFDIDDESFSVTGSKVTKVDQKTEGAWAVYHKSLDDFYASLPDKAVAQTAESTQ